MILNDFQLAELCCDTTDPMITPYVEGKVSQVEGVKVISYGQSPFGYDITLAYESVRIFQRVPGEIINPKRFNESHFVDATIHCDQDGLYFILPGNSYALAVSDERFDIPADILAIGISKSTYARCGISVNITPLEPGWRGHLTIEIFNASPADCRVYIQEGIAQLVFFRGEKPFSSYGDGKYQDQQKEVTNAR